MTLADLIQPTQRADLPPWFEREVAAHASTAVVAARLLFERAVEQARPGAPQCMVCGEPADVEIWCAACAVAEGIR